MGILKLFVIILVVFAYSVSSFAATLIESVSDDGEAQKMWIEGSKMRVDISSEPSYMLIDVKTGKMYAINTVEKEALEMSSAFQGDSENSASSKYIAKLVKVGQGPAIAGYATEQYQFMVNGRKCSDEFLSKDALKDIGSLDVFESLSKMQDSESMDFGMGMMDPCDSVQVSFDKTYRKLGFPLKIVDKDGSGEFEVVRITRNVSVPPGGFEVPAGYEVVNMEQMMQESMQGLYPEKGKGGMPSQEGEMGQEDINPEKLQQMIQEMMQQMGQEK